MDMNEGFPLYERLAASIRAQISGGALRPGDRVPSVRHLSRARQVSISTVLQAYRKLEDDGVIEARPQSGYYVRYKQRRLPEPAISSPPQQAQSVDNSALVATALDIANRPNSVPLATASPGPALFPTAKLQRCISGVARRHPTLATTYSFRSGHPELCRQIARRALDWGSELDPGEIIITNGCMEALNLALRCVTCPGDTIALESPAYFGLLQISESLGLKVLEIPTHPRDGLSVDAFDFATRSMNVKACVVVSNVGNPLGSVMPESEKRRLVAFAAERDIALIEDAIYSDLYDGPLSPSLAKAYDKTGNVIVCSSFSKTLAPGLRIGWMVPGRRRQQIEMLKFINSLMTSEVPQLAIAEFLASGGYDHHLRRLRRAFREQMEKTAMAVAKYFPEGTRVSRPQGGFLLWVELPDQIDSIVLMREAAKESISIAPGPLFSTTDRYLNFARISCGYPWSADIERAIRRLGEMARMQHERKN
jgi:DNA-binding transcriptional MocR family regulator